MDHRRFALIFGVLSLGLIGGLLAKEAVHRNGHYVERYIDGRLIPPSGLTVNPHGLKGLANDVEGDFRTLHAAMVRYAKEKGTFPEDPRLLIEFTAGWSEGQRVTPVAFYTPDYRKSDHFRAVDETFCYEWTYRTPRADGKKKAPFPPRGKRDVWLATEVYVRNGKTVFRDGTFKDAPQGFYLTMWSDGKIERTPLRDRLLATLDDGGQTYFFRGEAGSVSKMVSAGEERATGGHWWPGPAGVPMPAALASSKG